MAEELILSAAQHHHFQTARYQDNLHIKLKER
jgi:hypothetical protein